MSDIIWHQAIVTRKRRYECNRYYSFMLWFTGLSGSENQLWWMLLKKNYYTNVITLLMFWMARIHNWMFIKILNRLRQKTPMSAKVFFAKILISFLFFLQKIVNNNSIDIYLIELLLKIHDLDRVRFLVSGHDQEVNYCRYISKFLNHLRISVQNGYRLMSLYCHWI